MLKSIAKVSQVVLTACAVATAAPAAQAADTIKIGLSVSSTGSFALASQSGERGIDIWADEVNARGGIPIGGKKRKVELIKLDDRSDKQQVAKVYESLIQDRGADVVIAPFGSTLTGVAATVTERLDRFMVIWSAAADAIYKQGFTRLISASQMPVSVMPKAEIDAAKTLGVKKMAIIYVDAPFPAGLAVAAESLAKQNGIEIVMMEKYANGTKDFSTMLEKAKALGADGFYPSAYENDQIAMVRQMKELDITFPFSFIVYASQPQFLQIGHDADFLFSHTNFHEAVNWKVNAGLDRTQFLAAYARLFPKVNYAPDFQTALAYGAAVVMEKIIEKAGTTDAAKLKAASLDLSKKLTVLSGPYEIDAAGTQLGMPFVVVQNQKDGVKAVYPEAVANAKAVYPIPPWSKR
ncbi:MAG: amino acid ABC transporter substrate-binding protein [Rhodospirillaceae bacterium]